MTTQKEEVAMKLRKAWARRLLNATTTEWSLEAKREDGVYPYEEILLAGSAGALTAATKGNYHRDSAQQAVESADAVLIVTMPMVWALALSRVADRLEGERYPGTPDSPTEAAVDAERARIIRTLRELATKVVPE